MKQVLAFVLAAFIPVSTLAADGAQTDAAGIIRSGEDSDLSEFLWIKRPIIVFADTPADPRFRQQMERLEAELDELEVRDVVVLTDTDPGSDSALRTKLRPRGFMVVLVGKDGLVYLRKPNPYTVRDISRSIDKMPTRQREIRERRSDG